MTEALARYEFAPVDWHLASTLAKYSPVPSEELKLAAALVSKRCRQGHTCAALGEVAGLSLAQTETGNPGGQGEDTWPLLQHWLDKLRASGSVAEADPLNPAMPLVLLGERLYLSRYFYHEKALAQSLRERIEAPPHAVDLARMRATIDRIFAPLHPESEKQRLAVALALLARLCIVTGGPGTGKTTTIVRMLACLVEQARARTVEAPRILIVAPTGKAASRIAESIRESKAGLALDDRVGECIPDSAITIHRALGLSARADYSGPARMAADVVIVERGFAG